MTSKEYNKKMYEDGKYFPKYNFTKRNYYVEIVVKTGDKLEKYRIEPILAMYVMYMKVKLLNIVYGYDSNFRDKCKTFNLKDVVSFEIEERIGGVNKINV